VKDDRLPVDSCRNPRTWDNFTQEFKDKYVPLVAKQASEREFMDLTQGSQSVSQYKATFSILLPYAPYIQENESLQTQRFI